MVTIEAPAEIVEITLELSVMLEFPPAPAPPIARDADTGTDSLVRVLVPVLVTEILVPAVVTVAPVICAVVVS